MRFLPESSSVILLTVVVCTFHHVTLGCFQELEPLKTSTVWVQATGIQAYLQYETWDRSMDTIRVIPRGRDKSGQVTLRCLSLETSSQVLVETQKRDSSTGNLTAGFQCLRFGVLSKRVLRVSRTELKSSRNEVNCATDVYNPDVSVLVDASDTPTQNCPLHGSFGSTLGNPLDDSECRARIDFNCHNDHVMVTFGPTCKPPIYRYNTNKVRYHSSTQLRCIDDWLLQGSRGDETKVLVLQSSSSNIWCLHYKTVNKSVENFQVYISFDGRCASNDPFIHDNKDVFSKDTMVGFMANFVSARDTRCSDKIHTKHCSTITTNCSQTNACPGECGRCFSISKPDTCNFMSETMGTWKVIDSTEAFSVTMNKDSFETSTHGKFMCRYSDETNTFAINPVMQYDKNDKYCMPSYACMQMFSLAPGVSSFYLRQTVTVNDDDTAQRKLVTCEQNNQLYRDYPVPEGQTITLVDESKLQPTTCFIEDTQFETFREPCRLNVEKCPGKSCVALNISFDNETCHDNLPVRPIAKTHRCLANLKFPDGLRGLLTYSDELEKYSCWLYSSVRLFVTEPKMCNSEAVTRVFADKHADVKFDPIKAFTIPVVNVPSSSESSVPCLYVLCICVIYSIVCSMDSWL